MGRVYAKAAGPIYGTITCHLLKSMFMIGDYTYERLPTQVDNPLLCLSNLYVACLHNTVGMEQEARLDSTNRDTLRMVEHLISKEREFTSMSQLCQALPKQIQHQALEGILERLEDSNKIMVDENGSVTWIFTDNPRLEKLHEDSVRLR